MTRTTYPVPWKFLFWATVLPGSVIGWYLPHTKQVQQESTAFQGLVLGFMVCMLIGTLWFIIGRTVAWIEHKIREGVAAELTLRGVDPDREPEDVA